jgi:transcriptional regulator with XRE-family HTH domain
MEFKEWIFKKYLDWQAEIGVRKSMSEFANYLGVSQQTISVWMNGRGTPSGKNVYKLGAQLGWELYDMLGLPRPELSEEAAYLFMAALVRMYPPEQRPYIRQALMDTLQQMIEDKQIDPEVVFRLVEGNIKEQLEAARQEGKKPCPESPAPLDRPLPKEEGS